MIVKTIQWFPLQWKICKAYNAAIAVLCLSSRQSRWRRGDCKPDSLYQDILSKIKVCISQFISTGTEISVFSSGELEWAVVFTSLQQIAICLMIRFSDFKLLLVLYALVLSQSLAYLRIVGSLSFQAVFHCCEVGSLPGAWEEPVASLSLTCSPMNLSVQGSLRKVKYNWLWQ